MKQISLILFTLFFCALSFSKSADPRDEEVFALLKKNLSGRGDVARNQLTRLGNKTIQLETFLSLEGSLESAKKILGDLPSYSKWILKDINVSPTGEKYYLQMISVFVDPKTPNDVLIEYSINLPVFKHNAKRKFKANPQTALDHFYMGVTNIPDERSIIERTEGEMRVFAAADAPNRIWVHMKGQLKLRPWLVYEALPERLITREIGERIEIMLKNFQQEDDRLEEAKKKG